MGRKIYFNSVNPLGYTGNTRGLVLSGVSKHWLESQPTYTLHRPVRRRGFPMRKYKTTMINHQWQADLVDMQALSRRNGGANYILTCIDVFSRYAFACPLKTKAFPHVIEGFKQIFTRGGPPALLQTDEGKEFLNRNIQAFFRERGVHQFSIKSEFKAALVERFHRTLRARMYRYFTQSGSQRWVDVLPSLLISYNTAKHRSLHGYTPTEVYYDDDGEASVDLWDLRNLPINVGRAVFKIGDRVRLALTKTTFNRGYTPNWTREIFIIDAVHRNTHPVMYSVRDVDGKFYAQNLQRVVYK